MRLGDVLCWVIGTLTLGAILSCLAPRAFADSHKPSHRFSLISASVSVIYETFVDEEAAWGVAIGAEYENRLSKWWGLGLLMELTSETRDFLLAAPVSFHFWRGARLIAAPAIEIGVPKTAAVRIGFGYDWDTSDNHSVGFEFFADFLEDDRRTFLLGVSGGKIF